MSDRGPAPVGGIHHVEIWVPDLAAADASWGWMLGALGYREESRWSSGVSWQLGDAYLVIEQGPDVRPGGHERTRPGVNHLAFWAGTRADVDRFADEAPEHGWRLLFSDRHPFAGGPEHYAAYLENEAGYEIELVARG